MGIEALLEVWKSLNYPNFELSVAKLTIVICAIVVGNRRHWVFYPFLSDTFLIMRLSVFKNLLRRVDLYLLIVIPQAYIDKSSLTSWWRITLDNTGLNDYHRHLLIPKRAFDPILNLLPENGLLIVIDANQNFWSPGSVVPLRRKVLNLKGLWNIVFESLTLLLLLELRLTHLIQLWLEHRSTLHPS